MRNYKFGKNQKCFFEKNFVLKAPLRKRYFDKKSFTKYEIMQANKNLFAEIYDLQNNLVKQELLNDESFLRDMRKLVNQLKISTPFKGTNFVHKMSHIIQILRYDINTLELSRNNLDDTTKLFLDKLKNYILEISEYEKLQIYPFDLHCLQFGYNKVGQIKVFDI